MLLRRRSTATSSIVHNLTETSSLLPPDTRHERASKPWIRRSSSITSLILIAVALASFADQLVESPETRIIESVICYRHYEQSDPSKINLSRDAVGPGAIGGVDEHLCKTAAVQHQLAELNGYRLLLDGVPALLLAIPFGWAADSYKCGRWPIIFMNLFHMTLRAGWVQIVTWHWQVFHVSAIYWNTILCLLGGGNSVIVAIFYVMLSDTNLPEKRAAAFLRLGAVNISAAVLMPPLSALLMEKSPWIPYFLGLAFYALATLAFLFVPETLNYRHEDPTTQDDVASPSTGNRRPSHATVLSSGSGVTHFKHGMLKTLTLSLSFLTDDLRVVALILPFTAHILMGSLSKLLLQYASTRYGLTLAEATLLVTVRNGVTAVLLFVALPYLTIAIMQNYGLSGQAKDLFLARVSQILIAVGWLLVATSPNIPTAAVSLAISSLGVGAIFLVRSLLTSLLPAHHIARVYTIISMVDTVGMMVGAPLLARLFSRGLSLGNGWIGLPFYYIGGLSALFATLLFFVRLDEDKGTNEEERM